MLTAALTSRSTANPHELQRQVSDLPGLFRQRHLLYSCDVYCGSTSTYPRPAHSEEYFLDQRRGIAAEVSKTI